MAAPVRPPAQVHVWWPDAPDDSVILVQAENEYSAGSTHNSYMQAIIDLYRAEGIVVRKSHSHFRVSQR
jgi:hypothetical protein